MKNKLKRLTKVLFTLIIVVSTAIFAFICPTKEIDAASATIASSVQSTNGSPYVIYTFSLSYSRSGNTVTVTPSCSAHLRSSGSSLGTGKGLVCGVAVGSSGWKTWTVKSTSASWSGTGSHSATGSSFSVSVSNTTTSLSTQVRATRSDSTGSAGILSARSGSSISFSANTSYTVSYNANGGTGTPSSQTKWYGSALTLSTTLPTKDGYDFVGWNTSNTATTASYKAGGSYTGNAALTLYAIWSKTITLKYDANGGTNAPETQSEPIYTSTTEKEFTLTSNAPTRVGYTFKGWNTDKTATTAKYTQGSKATFSDNTTLYAVWLSNKCDPFLEITS